MVLGRFFHWNHVATFHVFGWLHPTTNARWGANNMLYPYFESDEIANGTAFNKGISVLLRIAASLRLSVFHVTAYSVNEL